MRVKHIYKLSMDIIYNYMNYDTQYTVCMNKT